MIAAKEVVGGILWFIAGGAVALSAVSTIGFGAYTLLPSLGLALLFLALRIPRWWMLFIGSGSLVAVLWTLHITSGDTPDDSILPILVGLALLTTGVLIRHRLQTH